MNKKEKSASEWADAFNEYKREQEERDTIITKKSITEPQVIVDFNETRHEYNATINGRAEKLKGGTTIIKQFFKPFDEKTATRCAKIWNTDEEDLRDLWKRKGADAALFGTAIHNALETFTLHREEGERLAKDGFNYALPSHPVLRQIILDFTEISDKLDDKYDVQHVLPEALVTDAEYKYSGLIDRLAVLDYDKKICRIQDYKVNKDADKKDKYMVIKKPFNKLSKTKLSKYQLQLSTYAHLMIRHGWTVTGLDAFVYGENGWEYYELEVLDMAPHLFKKQ